MKLRERVVLLLVTAAIFAWGCTFTLPMDPKVPTMPLREAMLPARVGLVIDAETQAREASFIAGNATYAYAIGKALEKIVPEVLPLLFSTVERVNTTHPLSPGLNGAIQILIDEAFLTAPFNPARQGEFASATILLKCVVYDREGRIATLTSRGYARGEIRFSVWGGYIPSIYQGVLGPVADQALQRAMGELLGKLREDDKVKRLASPRD